MESSFNPEYIHERLAFYYNKMNSYDEEEQENYQVLIYIKERISFWKKELMKAEEEEFFRQMNNVFGIE